MTWGASLSPLRARNFAWYYASRSADTLGTTMGRIALAFAVLDLTGSPAALGQVAAAHTVPMVLCLLFGGVIADRFPRSLVLQASNLSAAASQAVLAWLVITERAELWMVLVLAAVNGAGDALGLPAIAGMVPQLVTREHLQRANALLSLSRGLLSSLGPSIGALLVVTVGSGWALAINAGAWLLSAALLVPVRMPARPRRQERAGTWRDLRDGWALFAGTTWLWVVVVSFGFLNAIHVGAWFILGPAAADDTIGRQGWGLVLSAHAVGLLAMTVLLLRVHLSRPLLSGMLGCALMSLPLMLLGVYPHLGALILANLLAGAGTAVFQIGWDVAMQENIAQDKLSRAYSYDALGSFIGMPLGQLSYGFLGESAGYHDVLALSAIAYLTICLLSLAAPAVRNLARGQTAAAS